MEASISEKVGCMVDRTGRIVFISDAIHLYGYTQGELTGANIMELLDPRTAEPGLFTVRECGKSYESRLITKDKIIIPAKIRSIGSIEISNGSLQKLYVSRIVVKPDMSDRDITEKERIRNITVKAGDDAADNDFLTAYYDHICM